MSDKENGSAERILKELEELAKKRLDLIQNKILTSGKTADENIQILMDVTDDLEDILLYWEDTYVPDRLKILDNDD